MKHLNFAHKKRSMEFRPNAPIATRNAHHGVNLPGMGVLLALKRYAGKRVSVDATKAAPKRRVVYVAALAKAQITALHT